MTMSIGIFLVIIILNTLVSAVYLMWNITHISFEDDKKKGRDNQVGYILKGVVMLLCPIVGPMFFFTGYIIYFVFFRKPVDLADVIFSKERVKVHKRADTEREGNLAPIEEALAISDKDTMRTLMMNVVRGDIKNSLASIELALNSEDTETSHYAASILRDELNDFRQKSQEYYNKMKLDNELSVNYACVIIEYMNDVLIQEVFHGLEQLDFVKMMEDAEEYLYVNDREKLTAEYIEWICILLLNIKEYNEMEKWCERSRQLYPEDLSSFTCRLKLYFTIEDKDKFFGVLNELKQSDIVIDKETLALIRIFS